MRFWTKHSEPDPASGDDATPAWVVQEVSGDPGTDYETPGRMHARAETDGHGLGAAGVPKEEAVGEDSGAVGWISGGAKAREGMVRLAALVARTAANKIVDALPGRLEANAAQHAAVKEKTKRLRTERLPEAQASEEGQTAMLRALRERFEQLPRHKKGYFGHVGVLVAIELAVVAFDGGALYGALKHAGFSGVVLVYVMVAVPALIAAVNHGAGLLAGAIGLKLADDLKLKAAAAAFAAILGALVCAFVMLVFFRDAATTAQNAGLATWASGKLSTTPNLLISPNWLGPAQIAGSFAAIAVVGCWTAAREGRELTSKIAAAEAVAYEREADRRRIEGEIEGVSEQETELAVAAAQMKTTAAEADADIKAHDETLAAKLETEQGLKQAATGRLVTSFVYTNQVYRNGEVVRVAVPTITTRRGRRVTPPPGDAEGQPFRKPSPGSNGHQEMTPEELAGLV